MVVTAPPAPVPTTGTIDEGLYIGKNADEVVTAIKALGFTNVVKQAGATATVPEDANMVQSVTPNGEQPFTQQITVTYAVEP